jgi:hypothetical protein
MQNVTERLLERKGYSLLKNGNFMQNDTGDLGQGLTTKNTRILVQNATGEISSSAG